MVARSRKRPYRKRARSVRRKHPVKRGRGMHRRRHKRGKGFFGDLIKKGVALAKEKAPGLIGSLAEKAIGAAATKLNSKIPGAGDVLTKLGNAGLEAGLKKLDDKLNPKESVAAGGRIRGRKVLVLMSRKRR